MLVSEFESTYGVRIRERRATLLGRLLSGWILRRGFYFTYRLPCQARATITHDRVLSGARSEVIPRWVLVVLQHELVHVDQLSPWYGPLLLAALATVLPLPVFFSGRWLYERSAYLHDINCGQRTVESAVQALWWDYGYPWPPMLMRRWFMKMRRGDTRG